MRVPITAVPESGAIVPRISFNKVVLPAPLGPSRPTLSPRKIVAVKSCTIGRSYDLDMFCKSATILPLRSPADTANFTWPMASRRCARLARSFSRRAIRPTLRVRRASTPLRIQTSSCANILSALALAKDSAFSS